MLGLGDKEGVCDGEAGSGLGGGVLMRNFDVRRLKKEIGLGFGGCELETIITLLTQKSACGFIFFEVGKKNFPFN
jgi:hypothetical protein